MKLPAIAAFAHRLAAIPADDNGINLILMAFGWQMPRS